MPRDANSGLINLGGGVVIDTQSDLSHARRMIELFGTVWTGMPRRVVNTHEDGDHVWGNPLFEGAEIIAHRTVPDRMLRGADPQDIQQLLEGTEHYLSRMRLKATHPGALAYAGSCSRTTISTGSSLRLRPPCPTNDTFWISTARKFI
jgi:cyclase